MKQAIKGKQNKRYNDSLIDISSGDASFQINIWSDTKTSCKSSVVFIPTHSVQINWKMETNEHWLLNTFLGKTKVIRWWWGLKNLMLYLKSLYSMSTFYACLYVCM